MKIPLNMQLVEFLYSALLGVILGVVYDIFAIIRSYIKGNKLINIVFDVLFWCISLATVLAFVMLFTNGAMRMYILLGNFFGIFIYKNTISPLFFCSVRIIISLVVKGLNLISRPIYAFCAWIYKICRKGSERVAAHSKKIKKKKQTEKRTLTIR
ncbi:MAG: spore cortex biosynthesis protein YabQ [Clostridia bacterium]|nr:spore cortex biosynthesis protein YabQ [Clostridia bacterium]